MNDRYESSWPPAAARSPRSRGDVYLVVIDEYAYFSATVGKEAEAEFAALTVT